MISLHNHTDASFNDGAIPLQFDDKKHESDLVDRLKEIGCTAFATTEHGNMISDKIVDAILEDSGIKHIHGVEAYIERGKKRDHLVIIAQDLQGYQELMKAVTASNDNRDGNGFPMMSDELLNQYFGPGSKGHGHVIALSACAAGVVCSQLLHNAHLEKDAVKEEKKAGKYEFDEKAYAILESKLADKETEYFAVKSKRELLGKLKAKTYTKRIKDLQKLIHDPHYEEMRKALDNEKIESARAAEEFPAIKAAESALSKECTALKSELKKQDSKLQKISVYTDAAKKLRDEKISDAEMFDNAVNRAKQMSSLFGKDNFFLELQYHGIPDEAICYPELVNVAKETGLPMCATNDAHMLTNSEQDRTKRRVLRSLRYNNWEEEQVGDSELYLKTDEELEEWLSKIISQDVAKAAIANNSIIADRCNVVFPKEDHYPKWKGEKTALETLYDLIREGQYKVSEWTPEYKDRLRHEIHVIRKLKVVDYIVIVADFLRYGELLGKIDLNDPRYLADPYNIELLKELAKGRVGKGTGLGRGSAVGSLVCYLVGITQLDPLKYGLLFERFLNEDRVTMPDIDSDFAPDIRNKVIDYVRYKYGDKAVCCIMTVGTQTAKAAIRNCARIIGSREKERNGGDETVKKRFYNLGADICDLIPTDPGIKLTSCEKAIREKFENNPEAMEILDTAILVEGTYTNVGTHAAGVIIADNGDVREYVPLMYAKDGQRVTQFDKDYSEGIGLLKMDFLGLRNLSIITETLRLIEKDTGEKIDIDEISLDDMMVYKTIFQSGRTNSVFQFESQGMKALLKRFQPENIMHLTLLNAMYRPGPLQYIDEVCNVKAGKERPHYIIPEMETILGETYGKPIYQEQIMQIFNKFAGFTLSESDTIRRYMSKKKTEKFMAYHDKFIDGLVENGANKNEAENFWSELVDFSKYCFNKSHAAAYAVTAYYTAWLKCKYPKEYLTSVLNDTDFNKISTIIDDVRYYGIKVLPPDVNTSGMIFTPNPSEPKILYGLSNIKGVAGGAKSVIAEREENGPFKNLEDFVTRTGVPKDTLEALIQSGACDCLSGTSNSRQWRKDVLTECGSKNIPTDEIISLIQEKEALGTFLTANPAKGYKAKYKLGSIGGRLFGRIVQVVGVITDFKIRTTKSGSEMAMFKFEDDTGSIQCCAFPQAYSEYRSMLHDNAIISIVGRVQSDNRSEDDETYQLNVSGAFQPEREIKSIILKSDQPAVFKDVILQYSDPSLGVPLMVIMPDGEVKQSKTKVKVSILGDNRIAEHLIAE